MTQLALEDLEVTSFFPGDDTTAALKDTIDYNCCTIDYSGCVTWTEPVDECFCTADFSSCSRTSIEGGCDTSVQCVTG